MRQPLLPGCVAVALLAPPGDVAAGALEIYAAAVRTAPLSVPAPARAILAQSDGAQGHGGDDDPTSFTFGDLVIENPWARESVTRTGAAYLSVRNDGSQDDRLVGVASEVAERAELHASVMDDGIMRMRPVEAVEVPAHGEAVLEPGGLHVMLVGLKGPLEEGGSFPLTLVFENAGEVEVTATIEDIGYGGAGHEHGQ